LILNIRGCSGSGKTHLIRQIMEELGPPEPILDPVGKPEGYLLRGNIRLVGRYESACGGCDRLRWEPEILRRFACLPEGKETLIADLAARNVTEEDIKDLLAKAAKGRSVDGFTARSEALVRRWATIGHIIFEGLMISSVYARYLKLSKELGGMVWALLDTPVDVCIKRVLERNGGKPINEDYVHSKWETTRKHYDWATAEGEKVVWIDHTRAFEQVMEIIRQEVPELRPANYTPPGETSGKTFILPLDASRLCPF